MREFPPGSSVWGILFISLIIIILKNGKIFSFLNDRRTIIFSAVLSFILAFSYYAGAGMRFHNMTPQGFAGKGVMLFKCLLLSVLFFPLFGSVFEFADRISEKKTEYFEEKKTGISVAGMFFISFGIIFLCWIPVFLAYYPAIMSYDSNRQFNEAYNGIFWELQPIVHTWLIQKALYFGESIGSYEKGVSIYTLFQMTVLAASLAYANSFVYELIRKKWVPILLAFLFGLHPVFSVLAMVVTKDILFSAFFLCFMVLSLKRYLKIPKHPILFDLAMIACAVLITIFRKNGIYGIAAFSIVYVFAMKKERIRVLVVCILMIACAFGSTYLMRALLHAGHGPKTEMYSVPIQQMGHVVFFQKDSLSEEELVTMEKYLTGCTVWEDFNITLADAQKACANPDAWTDTPNMLKDWLHFGVRFPDDYLDAYLGLTSGYYFLDDISISRHLGYGRESMRGLIETFNASKPLDDCYPGVESVSKLPGLQYFLEGFVSDEQYLKLPLIGATFRPATYCWAAVVLYAILLYKKRYRAFAAASLQLVYFLTVAMGPVANIRYVFQLMIGLPLLLTFVIISLREKQ